MSRSSGGGNGPLNRTATPQKIDLTDDERFVMACVTVGQQHRRDPFLIARQAKNWSVEQWETLYAAYRQKEQDRWNSDEDE